jgi:type IV pilus assembly protein PilY1
MGSGPTTLDGTSTQEAKVAVFRLKNLMTNPRGAFQIPDSDPTAPNETGRFLLSPAANNGFVSDFITVDFDLVENYRADVIYFGTVEGTWGDSGLGGWGGKVYRLVTHKEESNGSKMVEVVSTPSEWAGLLADNPMPLIDVGRPVTAAPAIGWDGKYRWVYFGTGRFFDKDDKTDSSSNAQETYYGIKEPQDCSGDLTWATVEKSPGSLPNKSTVPGARGLLQVDQILVQEASTMVGATLGCVDTTTDCLPVEGGSPIGTFDELVDHIVGTGCSSSSPDEYTGTDGWYKEFSAPRERNLGQATLLGGLLTFTTYQPFDDVCLPEGMAFLYGSYYQTGTAWHDRVFAPSGINVDDGGNMVDRLSIGRGLALTPNLHVGRHKGSKAFVQTSTGAIVEIPQPNLPIENAKSGRTVWDQVDQVID